MCFESILRVWGILGTVLARASTIGTETKTETKQNQAKVKDRAKPMFLVDFVLQWIFSYQKHVLKLEKSMDKAHAHELFIFGAMFGPCWEYI